MTILAVSCGFIVVALLFARILADVERELDVKVADDA